MIERCHQTVGNMIKSAQIRDKTDLDPEFGFDGLLSAVRKAMNATVHTTSRATPSQLAFNRDAMLNVSFEADWQFIKNVSRSLSYKTINGKMQLAFHMSIKWATL